MAYTETEARELVVEAGRKLLEEGLVARTWGNISARVSDSRFVITPSGMGYDALAPEDLVLVDGWSGSWEGAHKPSSERGIHADAYYLRQDVNFVIHTHQDMASICGTSGADLITDHPLLGGRVPCAAYGLPSTKRLRRAAAAKVEAFPESSAILLRRHGAVCMGRDMDHAFAVAAALEEVCLQQAADALEPPELPVYIPDFGESSRREDGFLLCVDGKETVCSLEGPYPSQAAALHAAIYQNSDARAVIHLRDPDVTAVSMSRRRLRPMVDDLAQIAGGDICCVPNPGRPVLRGLRHRSAVMILGAGALCTGSSREEAVAVAQLLIKGCRAIRFAGSVPGCRPLGRGDAWLQRLIYVTQYAKRKG